MTTKDITLGKRFKSYLVPLDLQYNTKDMNQMDATLPEKKPDIHWTEPK